MTENNHSSKEHRKDDCSIHHAPANSEPKKDEGLSPSPEECLSVLDSSEAVECSSGSETLSDKIIKEIEKQFFDIFEFKKEVGGSLI